MRFRFCNLTLIIVLLVTSGAPSPLHAAPAASPPHQGTGDLCKDLLPEPFSGLAKPWDILSNTADICSAGQWLYGDDRYNAWANFTVMLLPDEASAVAALESMPFGSSVAADKFQPSSRYGDAGLYGLQPAADAYSSIYVDIAFVYGCYYVRIDADIQPASHISPDFASTTYAGYVAQALKGRPRCPNAAPAPTTPSIPPSAKLTVGLGCAIGNAPNTMRCAASVYDTLPGANIVYKWAVNGKEQVGVTGAELTVENLARGEYIVSVMAIDQAHGNVASQPNSAVMTIAKGPAPAGSAGFKVQLSCMVSELPDRSRQVDCTATAENPPVGANLKYIWNWNGVSDYMQSGATFQYRGMSSGTNTISVNALDVASSSRSESAATTVDIPWLDGSPADGSDAVPTPEELSLEVGRLADSESPDVKDVVAAMLNHFSRGLPDKPVANMDVFALGLFESASTLALAINPANGHPLYPSVLVAMPKLEEELWQVSRGVIPLATVEQHLGLLVAMDRLLR
jgi:hypothetical protein